MYGLFSSPECSVPRKFRTENWVLGHSKTVSPLLSELG
jgi:hypothetical protein